MATEMLDHLMSAQRFQQMDRMADEYLEPYRLNARSMLEYFVGRFYGVPAIQVGRPLNLIAQTIRGFLPKLVPSRLIHYCEPRRYGLELEARVLRRLVEIDDEREDIIHNVFEPMIAEAWFYPMSVCYTGLRPGLRTLDIMGNNIDPGEPFTLHIPFERWACDIFAEDYRSRQWERHGYRVPRTWMLESPAFSHLDSDEIMAIPAWEDSQEGRLYMERTRGAQSFFGGAQYAFEETIELRNVMFYDRSGMYEATICPYGRGPTKWLRAVKYDLTRDGPYDHLWYQGVPSMLLPAALLGFTRDIAEAGDMLMRKNIDSAIRSKKILGYSSGHEDEAKALLENAHGTMINMEDPQAGQVFDLNLMSTQLVQMVEFVKQEWDQANQNPTLAAGGPTDEKTLGQSEIRNARTGEQVQFLRQKISRVITRSTRKRVTLFQTDPAADHVVDVAAADGTTMELAYNAENRQGGPDDFAFDSDVSTTTGDNPELAMQRVLDVMESVQANMPLFQMGVFDLGKYLRFMGRHGAEGLDQITGDPSQIQERMMVDQLAQAHEDAAAGGVGAGGQIGGQPVVPQGPAPNGGAAAPPRPATMRGQRARARAPVAAGGR